MVQTRRQAALALAAAPAADAIVRAPRKPRAAKSSAETAKLAVESLLPPEIYLMIMEVLIAQKKLKTLLEFSVASKQCADLGLSILKRYPRRSVWVALAESDEYDIIELGPFPNNDDEVVAVCSSYQGARAALREEFVDLDFPALHFDFGGLSRPGSSRDIEC